jgi:hypothetical protein
LKKTVKEVVHIVPAGGKRRREFVVPRNREGRRVLVATSPDLTDRS